MWQPAWKHLVTQLKDERFESPYLDRLRQRVHVYLERPTLEQEIISEMALSLGKAEDKINVALLKLDVLAHAIRHARSKQERRTKIREYNQQRAEAKEALFEFLVHRESLGFRRHHGIRELYPIPQSMPEEYD
jgi:hypothetical protein